MIQSVYTIWQEKEGWVSRCLISGVTSCGSTQEEAIEMLKEALELYYEDTHHEKIERQNFQFGSFVTNA